MTPARPQYFAQQVPKTAAVSWLVESPLNPVRLPAAVDARRDGPAPRRDREREASLSVEDLDEHWHAMRPRPSVFVRHAKLGLMGARCD